MKESFLCKTWGSLKNALIGCSAAVIFGLVVLFMSILSVASPEKVFPSEVAAVKDEVVVVMKVEYYLPYPGILPDSPLYKLKALRDKVRLVMTFDQEKKAEFELLYADKRIGAAEALIEGGKTGLGASTALKAEKYLEQSVKKTEELTKKGKDVKSLQLTQEKAVAKHGEILKELMLRTNGDDRLTIEAAIRINDSL